MRCSGKWYRQTGKVWAVVVNSTKSNTVCGDHLCFKNKKHKRTVGDTRCEDGSNKCYNQNPEHDLCTQFPKKEGQRYSYDECLEQCRDRIPGCYGFNFNPDQHACYHLVLPEGETARCNATATFAPAYMTATCNECPPNNSPRVGCGGDDAGTCPGK